MASGPESPAGPIWAEPGQDQGRPDPKLYLFERGGFFFALCSTRVSCRFFRAHVPTWFNSLYLLTWQRLASPIGAEPQGVFKYKTCKKNSGPTAEKRGCEDTFYCATVVIVEVKANTLNTFPSHHREKSLRRSMQEKDFHLMEATFPRIPLYVQFFFKRKERERKSHQRLVDCDKSVPFPVHCVSILCDPSVDDMANIASSATRAAEMKPLKAKMRK